MGLGSQTRHCCAWEKLLRRRFLLSNGHVPGDASRDPIIGPDGVVYSGDYNDVYALEQ